MANLNINPYWDDFNPDKNYQRVLAVPGRVEQAREFTTIQTMLQHQITRLASLQYRDGQVIAGCLLAVNNAKTQATISAGQVYAEGVVIDFEDSVTISISGSGREIIGLVKTEEIVTEVEDPSLKDPAQGYDNYNQAGAHRLRVTWDWSVISDSGYGVFELIDGIPPILADTDPKPKAVKEDVLDIIARRDYEKSGNFVVTGLNVNLVQHPTYKWDMKQLIVSAGTARIFGYNLVMSADYKIDLPVARETKDAFNEPWTFQPYVSATDTGGQFLLGERPVATIQTVVATVLAVDGYGSRSLVTRGQIPGGSDELSEDSVVEIVAVNQGGTWDPQTESFTGGTTFSSSAYTRDGNAVDWSPAGDEPATGSSYSVAYKFRKQMVKQIMSSQRSLNEALVHGDDSGNDTIDYIWPCETNDMTEWVFYVNDPVGGNPPDPDAEGFETQYVRDVDFVVTKAGKLDWYDYDVQLLEITKGSANGTDNLTGFTEGYSMGTILDVAYYPNPSDMSFDANTNKFVDTNPSSMIEYLPTTSYTSSIGVAQISWAPGGAEPTTSNTYFVAVRARKYKTATHPSAGHTYYVTYRYWDVEVNGDYLARDSFYKTWIGVGNAGNVLQHYGLEFENIVNFWRSYNYQNAVYNMDKPYPSTMVEVDYKYYLPRYVLLSFDAESTINMTYGRSSRVPKEPVTDATDKEILLASIYCPADSLDMMLRAKDVRTLKVLDLHNVRNRLIKTEQNLANTWLDMDAKSIPVTNKKGITTTAFHDNDRVDAGWPGTQYSIDPDWEELALPHVDSFYTATLDQNSSTCAFYNNLCTMVPNGTEVIEQNFYTGHESIAPYALANQDDLQSGQSAYMLIQPHGDTVIVPRTLHFSAQSDADLWSESDVAKLTNPTRWFSKGWSGGTEKRSVVIGSYGWATFYDTIDAPSTNQTQKWTSEYMRDIQGNCRQIAVTFTIPGGLIPTAHAELDYYLYFGGIRVTPTLTNSTPPGAVPGTFRPRPLDNGASGTFVIPPNVPEGRIEVKVTSTPMTINGNDWRQTLVAIYDAAVVEKLTMEYESCRCNCWCYCNCNCWNCRGRCGTGPLAETLEPVGRQRMLKEIAVDFYSANPNYGVFGCIVKTDNGNPTSNTVSDGMIARAFRSAADMVGAGMKTFTFDDPIYFKDEAYAIVVTGEDGFNLNSLNEIAAGRDIRCKIATLGKADLNTGKVVGSQPFKSGILWKSLTGVTWEQDQKSDLKFSATFHTYPTGVEHIAYMEQIAVSNATAFILNWDSTAPQGTMVTFEYRTQDGDWTEFSPYTITYLREVASALYFRARMKTEQGSISPFVAQFAGLYVQSTQTSMKAVTRNFEVDASDIVDIWLDTHLPSGASQTIRITFDNGVSWVTLNNNSNGNPTGNLIEFTPVDLNDENVKYRHHWKVQLTPPNTFTKVRVEITCNVIGAGARLLDPRFSRLIVIASSS
jgi:hypothetical protein